MKGENVKIYRVEFTTPGKVRGVITVGAANPQEALRAARAQGRLFLLPYTEGGTSQRRPAAVYQIPGADPFDPGNVHITGVRLSQAGGRVQPCLTAPTTPPRRRGGRAL